MSSFCLQLWARQLWLENVLWRTSKWDFPGNPRKRRTRRMAHNQRLMKISSVQSLSCVWLFATPWTAPRPGFPVHHELLELTQTHVHWVSDAIQPSHPLSSPSPPAFNLSQLMQGLFKWVSSSKQVAKVLEFQLQHQSMKIFPLNIPS